MSDLPIDLTRPGYYFRDGMEVRSIIRAWKLTYNLGTAVAYILRAGKKGQKRDDLEKAFMHLKFEIEDLKEKEHVKRELAPAKISECQGL